LKPKEEKMPVYVYRAKNPNKSCKNCKESFEVFQKISEPAVEICPECENPVVRLLNAVTTGRDTSTQKLLSDENLKKHGFKKLVNTGGGKFDEVV